MAKSIDIDLEVYKTIESARLSFEETHNDILKRLLQVANATQPPVLSKKVASRAYALELERGNLNEVGNQIADFQSAVLKERIKAGNYNIQMDWIFDGVRLPEGSKLRKWYRGKQYDAVIKNGSIFFEGEYYQAPSTAAMAITEGSNVNGWNFWEYFDEAELRWKKLSGLRK